MELYPIQYNNVKNLSSQSKERAMQVAKEFESIFTSIMLKSMRNTILKNDLIPESIGEDIYTDMLDGEYAKIISNNANFGLAEEIFKQIEQTGQASGMLDELSALGSQPWMLNPLLYPAPTNNNSFSIDGLTQKLAPWNEYINEASKTHQVDPDLISAVIAQESGGNPFAVSRAGAKGLMQLIDSTAQEMGVSSVFNPRENIMGGTKYLTGLLKEFKGNEPLALASYNAGISSVKKYGGIPPYRETQEYVGRVMQLRDSFKQQSEKQNVSKLEE